MTNVVIARELLRTWRPATLARCSRCGEAIEVLDGRCVRVDFPELAPIRFHLGCFDTVLVGLLEFRKVVLHAPREAVH